jgi:hypothetical protein
MKCPRLLLVAYFQGPIYDAITHWLLICVGGIVP